MQQREQDSLVAAEEWEALAESKMEWRTKLMLHGDKRNPTENLEELRREADLYWNVARSIRLGVERGQVYCACTSPPHLLNDHYIPPRYR